MKILMIGSPNSGIGWWRQRIPAEALKLRGHEVRHYQLDPLNAGPEKWLMDIAKEIENGWPQLIWTGDYGVASLAVAKQARKFNIPFVFDVDDLLENVPDKNPAFDEARQSGAIGRGLARMIPAASMMSCSTQFLTQHYARFPIQTALAPNLTHVPYWQKVRETPRRARGKWPPRVVLILNSNRTGDFRPLYMPLRKLAESGTIQIVTMGRFPEEFAGLIPEEQVVWVRPQPVVEFHRLLWLLQPEIVISRLEPNDFNLAKSNIKWQEATNVGAMFIGTHWGELAPLTECSALIAPSTDEGDVKRWVEVISDAARSTPETRQQLWKASWELLHREHVTDCPAGGHWNHIALEAKVVDGFVRRGDIERAVQGS